MSGPGEPRTDWTVPAYPRPAGSMSADEDRTPMTRTELAMLWDLLGRWLASHPGRPYPADLEATGLREDVDAEMAERFGG